jgi:hypothetical protein
MSTTLPGDDPICSFACIGAGKERTSCQRPEPGKRG